MALTTITARLSTTFTCDHPRCGETLHIQERKDGDRIGLYDVDPAYPYSAAARERRDSDLLYAYQQAGWTTPAASPPRHMCPRHKLRRMYPNH